MELSCWLLESRCADSDQELIGRLVAKFETQSVPEISLDGLISTVLMLMPGFERWSHWRWNKHWLPENEDIIGLGLYAESSAWRNMYDEGRQLTFMAWYSNTYPLNAVSFCITRQSFGKSLLQRYLSQSHFPRIQWVSATFFPALLLQPLVSSQASTSLGQPSRKRQSRRSRISMYTNLFFLFLFLPDIFVVKIEVNILCTGGSISRPSTRPNPRAPPPHLIQRPRLQLQRLMLFQWLLLPHKTMSVRQKKEWPTQVALRLYPTTLQGGRRCRMGNLQYRHKRSSGVMCHWTDIIQMGMIKTIMAERVDCVVIIWKTGFQHYSCHTPH